MYNSSPLSLNISNSGADPPYPPLSHPPLRYQVQRRGAVRGLQRLYDTLPDYPYEHVAHLVCVLCGVCVCVLKLTRG